MKDPDITAADISVSSVSPPEEVWDSPFADPSLLAAPGSSADEPIIDTASEPQLDLSDDFWPAAPSEELDAALPDPAPPDAPETAPLLNLPPGFWDEEEPAGELRLDEEAAGAPDPSGAEAAQSTVFLAPPPVRGAPVRRSSTIRSRRIAGAAVAAVAAVVLGIRLLGGGGPNVDGPVRVEAASRPASTSTSTTTATSTTAQSAPVAPASAPNEDPPVSPPAPAPGAPLVGTGPARTATTRPAAGIAPSPEPAAPPSEPVGAPVEVATTTPVGAAPKATTPVPDRRDRAADTSTTVTTVAPQAETSTTIRSGHVCLGGEPLRPVACA